MENSLPPAVCKPANFGNDLAKNGYVFLQGLEANKRSEEVAAAFGCTLTFGRTPVVHDIVPKSSAGLNTYSGMFRLDPFPLHTDMANWRSPPRYLMLRCRKGYEAVSTDLVDGSAVIERVGRPIVSRALVKPRRPLHGHTPLFSLFSPGTSGTSSMLRWDEVFIVPASPAGERGIARVKDELGTAPRISIALQSKGDTLFIDNWRMLHGRSAVDAAHTDRVIERAYLGELY